MVSLASTVSVYVPESLVGLPVAVTVYEPGVTLFTVKDPVKAPFEIAQVGLLTTLPEREQVESVVEKSEPET